MHTSDAWHIRLSARSHISRASACCFFSRSRKVSHDLFHDDFVNLRARLHVRASSKNGGRLMKSWIVGFGNDCVTLKYWKLLSFLSLKKSTKIDQNQPKLIKINQNWLKSTKIDWNWPKSTKTVLVDFDKFIWCFLKDFYCDSKKFKSNKINWHWPKLIKINRNRPKLTKINQNRFGWKLETRMTAIFSM